MWIQSYGKRKINRIKEVNANFVGRIFQQTHQVANNIVSYWDNIDALKDSETAKTAGETEENRTEKLIQFQKKLKTIFFSYCIFLPLV